MPKVPLPAEFAAAEWPADVMVEWLNRYDMRFIEGGLPCKWDGQDHGQSRARLWVRDQPPRPLDYISLTALCDVFLPRIWRRRPVRTPVGTVSLTIYFHADLNLLQMTGKGFLLGQARAQAFRHGYYDQIGQLWNEAGHLLATTHQVVYFKE